MRKGLGNYFYTRVKNGIQANHAQKLADILDRLEASGDVRDMKYPSSDLNQLKDKINKKKCGGARLDL